MPPPVLLFKLTPPFLGDGITSVVVTFELKLTPLGWWHFTPRSFKLASLGDGTNGNRRITVQINTIFMR